MQVIKLDNMPGTSVRVLETHIPDYIVGIVEIRESLPTEEEHTSEDWKSAISAGGFGFSDMLNQLRYAAVDRKKSHEESTTPMDTAKAEFMGMLMDELADARQDIVYGKAICLNTVTAKRTA